MTITEQELAEARALAEEWSRAGFEEHTAETVAILRFATLVPRLIAECERLRKQCRAFEREVEDVAESYDDFAKQLTAERDALSTEVEKHGEVSSSRARASRSIARWVEQADVLSAQLDKLVAERDALRAENERLKRADDMDHRGVLVDKLKAEVERMRPVFKVACGRWRTGHSAQVGSWPFQDALAEAVDAALASEAKETRCTCDWRDKDGSRPDEHAPDCAVRR